MYELFYEDLKTIIDKDIFLFIYSLLKDMILVDYRMDAKKKEDYLRNWVDKINKNIIKNKNNYISTEYIINNFNNILNFVKSQNDIYAGDILEAILIKIFGYAIKTTKNNTIEKNIFNNLSKIKNPNDSDLETCFISKKFKPKELKDIAKLLEREIYENFNDIKRKSPFYYFLFKILQLKYHYLFYKNNKKKSSIYINKGGIFNSQEINQNIYKSINDNPSSALDKDFKYNSISSLYNFLFGKKEKNTKSFILILRTFLISVFIFYQNENSPLMTYSKEEEKDDLVNIPFTYNLGDAYIEGKYAATVLSPCKLSNISKIVLVRNNLRELGIVEISKILLFNKNIKSIYMNSNLLKTYYLDFCNYGFRIYDNYSVEEINIAFNYLNEGSEEYLSKFLTHFKGLKTINLTSNYLKNGVSYFFITLKKLYRKRKIKLENLMLNKCLLDGSAFYELGELIKCKYCKLKRLYLSDNLLPSYINFLKKLKLNKTLIEIHLNKSNISDSNINDIRTIINFTNIKHIYLYKNKINKFDSILRLIYTTKLIKNENQEKLYNVDDQYFLINLDLSSNDIYNKNTKQIKLLVKIIKQMTLSCLDISHILYGPNPDLYLKNIIYKNHFYIFEIDLLRNMLKENKQNYYITVKKILLNEKNVKKFQYLENEEIIKVFDEKEINNIIKQKEAKYKLFLMEKAKEMILKLKEDKVKNDPILNKIYIDDKKVNVEEYKKVEEKLVNYMIFLNAKQNLVNLYKKRNERKLILI